MITVEHLSGLGQALKDLRWDARKTQAQISAKTGMNAPQLSRYENGHEVPSLESLVKYLSAIDRDVHDLQNVLTRTLSRSEIEDFYRQGRRALKKRRLEREAEEPARRATQKLELTKEEKMRVFEQRLREMEEMLAQMRED